MNHHAWLLSQDMNDAGLDEPVLINMFSSSNPDKVEAQRELGQDASDLADSYGYSDNLFLTEKDMKWFVGELQKQLLRANV